MVLLVGPGRDLLFERIGIGIRDNDQRVGRHDVRRLIRCSEPQFVTLSPDIRIWHDGDGQDKDHPPNDIAIAVARYFGSDRVPHGEALFSGVSKPHHVAPLGQESADLIHDIASTISAVNT